MNSEWSQEDELDGELKKEAASFRIEASDAMWQRLNMSLDTRKAALQEEEYARKRKRRVIFVSLMFGMLTGSLLTFLLLSRGLHEPGISEVQRHVAAMNSGSGEKREPIQRQQVFAKKPASLARAAVAEKLSRNAGVASQRQEAAHISKSKPTKPSSANGYPLQLETARGSGQVGHSDGVKDTIQDLFAATKQENLSVLNPTAPTPVFRQIILADSLPQAISLVDTLVAPSLVVAASQVDSHELQPDSASPQKAKEKVASPWTCSVYTGTSLLQAYREVNDWMLEDTYGRNNSIAISGKDEVKYSNAYTMTAGAGLSYRISDRWQLHAGLGLSLFRGQETHRFYTEYPDSFISALKPDPSRPVNPRIDTIYTGFLAQKSFSSNSFQYSLYRFSIPLMLSYQWPLRQNLALRVEAGCGLYYLAGGETQIYDYANNRFGSSRQQLRKLNAEFRLASTLACHLSEHWQLQGSIGFSQMLQSLYKRNYAGAYAPRQAGFSLGMAYSF